MPCLTSIPLLFRLHSLLISFICSLHVAYPVVFNLVTLIICRFVIQKEVLHILKPLKCNWQTYMLYVKKSGYLLYSSIVNSTT